MGRLLLLLLSRVAAAVLLSPVGGPSAPRRLAGDSLGGRFLVAVRLDAVGPVWLLLVQLGLLLRLLIMLLLLWLLLRRLLLGLLVEGAL